MSEIEDFLEMLEEEFGAENISVSRIAPPKQNGGIDQYAHLIQYTDTESNKVSWKMELYQVNINNRAERINTKYKIGIKRG